MQILLWWYLSLSKQSTKNTKQRSTESKHDDTPLKLQEETLDRQWELGEDAVINICAL